MKRRILIIILLLITTYSYSQRSISLVYFDNSKTYLAGGSISVHFKPIGIYPFDGTNNNKTTNFRLQLIKASDSSIVANNIGSEKNFFVPMLNGIIPNGTANGIYKIRVIADSSNTELSSVMTNSFAIQSGSIFTTTTLANPNPILSNIGDVSCFINNNHFGYLNKASGSISSLLTFELPNYDPAYTYNVKLINHETSVVTPITVNVSSFGGATTIELPSSLALGHYTLEIAKTGSGLTTTNSFIYYNNTGNTSLGNLSSENVCINTPISFSVDLSVIEKNYAGSYYVVTYGDNTKTDTFTQARFLANQSFLHSYSNPTCNFTPFPSNGKFEVAIQLHNKGLINTSCNLFSQNGNGTTKSVNTSTPPAANFYGKNPICLNDSAKFTNTTLLGYYGTTSVCNRDANFTWTIKKPSASSFSSVNAAWLDINKNLNVPVNIFNEAGIWQIKLTASNPQGCTVISEIIKEFCVQPQIVVGFKFNDGGLKDSIVACSPKVVNISNSTATVACSPTVFSWIVMRESDRGIIAPGTGIYTYSSGNNSSENPSFSFTSPGRYLIKLTASNVCKTDTLTRKVVLVGNNAVSLPPDIAYCGVRTIRFDTSLSHIPTYSSTYGNGESVLWTITPSSYSFVGGTTANSFYPQIQFNNNTTYNVTLTFNSNCPGGAITKTQTIRFDEPANFSIAPDKNPTVCRTNTNFTLNASATGASSTYTWNSINGTGTFSNVNSLTGTYTFNNNDKNLNPLYIVLSASPNAPNVCPIKKDSIRINFTPSNTVTSSTTKTICSGVSVNQLLTSSLTGSTFNWTSTVSTGTVTGNTNSTGTINDVLINASSTTDAVVTYTITPSKDGCNGTPATFTVTVKPQPNISSNNFINPTSCGGNNGSITLNGLTPNTSFYVSFSKNGGATTSINATSNASGQVTITGLTAGTYSNISVSSSPNNCTSNIIAPITLSDPSAPNVPTAGSNSPICSGQGNDLNLNASSTTTGVTYNWTGPNGFTSTNQNPSITNVSSSASGTYSVTATLAGCTSAATNVVVVVSQTPSTPIVSTPVEYCQNAVATPLNVTATSGNELQWYSTATGGTASNITPTPLTTTVGNVTFYVSQKNNSSSCESPRTPIVVTVKPIPTISSYTKTDPSQCASTTGSITLTGLTNGQQYVVSFIKGGIAQPTQTITSSGGEVVIPNLSAGTYTNITVTLNGCISNIIAGPIVLTDPNPPSTPLATSNSPICSGSTLSLSATSTTAGVTFNWSGPSSFNTTGANPTRNNTTTAMSGVYSVSATLNNCTSSAGTVTVTINQTPITPTVGSNSPVCSGADLNLTASSTTSGVSYAWSGPNGFSSTTQNPTISTVTTLASGTYSVTASTSTCTSLAGTESVTVKPTPNISGYTKTDPTQCASTTGSITLTGLTNGQQYVVSFIKGGIAQPTQTITSSGGELVIPNLSAGTYTNITVTLNGCISNTITGPIVLTDPNPPLTPVASSNGPICSGNALNLSATSSTAGAVQYNWSGPNSFISTNQNPSITSATTAASGTYSVTATLNSCVSAAGTIIVVVDSTPVAPSISSNSPLCYGNNLTFTTTINFPTTLTYAWTGPNGFTSSLQNPTIPSATELASGTYSLLITANAGNCSPGAVNTSVIVRPLLTQAHIAGLDTVFVCNFNPPANATQSLSANLNATRPFESGKWTIISQPSGSTANFANDNSPNTTITYNKSGLYQLLWTITNDANCPSTKDTVFLSIVDKPQITQDLSASSTNVCAGNPVTISIPNNQVIGTISKWQYKRPYNNQLWKDTLVTNPTITFNNVQDTFNVRLVVISTDQIHCSNDTAFKEITINVAPPSYPGITIGADTVCQGSNSGTIILTGNIGAPTWQSSTNGINFSNIPNSAVQNYTYNNLTGTTWFRAAVKSGVCDTVFSNTTKITVYPPVSIANAGADVELCGDSTYQLNANVPTSIETGVWSFASGSATATIHSPNAANTIVSNLLPNNNYHLVWTLSNGICPATTDEVEIKNYLPLTNTIDTSTITVCNSSVVNITGNSPVGGNTPYLYQWQILQGGIWVNIPGATSMSFSFTADSTVKIRRQVTALPCTNFSLEKTIYVQPPLANNTISGNSEACINTSPGVLIGSLPTGADGNYFYQWQIFQGASWVNIASATQKDFTIPILTVSTTYRRLVTSALCSGNQGLYSSPFVITVRPDAKAIWTITIDTACAPFNINNSIVSPVHQPLSNGSYNWYANDVFYGNNTTQNPGYILNNAGDSVIIKMVAVSLYGCKNDSVQHKFFTIPPVLTNFVLSDSIGCGPLSVTITNTTPYLGFFNYAWNFGNQQTSNLSQPGTIIFQSNPNFTDTTYYVSLTATSKCEVVTKTKTVTVKSKPKSIFTPDKTIGCSPLLINFTNISKGVGASYIWDFGDGTQQAIGTSQSVSHTYNTSVQDTFKVKLISINQCGTDTAVYNIVVAPSTLNLDFAVNGTEKQGCKPHSVKFINASSGASSFHWSFGDGNTLNTTKNIDTVNHTFLQSGSFTVTLFATNGCTDTSATETIQVFNPPTANFSATPLQACIGDTIYFHNQSDTTTSLLWNFKDGYTSSVTNPVHAFTTPGVYNVQLKAIRQYNSGLACTDSIIRPITIVSKLPGTFTVTDTISNCVPFTATFTNQTLPSSLTIWNFEPGINDTGNVVTHTFTQVGTYLVQMNVTHPGGCNYEATKEIKVIAPFGTFTYDKGIICGNTPLKFEVNAQNTDSIKWNFGDGNILTTSNPIVYHSYQQSGNFLPTATLIKNGCSVLLKGIDTIKVDYINAGFKYNSVQTCGNTKIQFIDTSRKYQPIASWLWNFGDGTFSSLQNPIKNYTASNSWQIKLIVTSITGCSDTITKNIFIKVNTNPSANINATVTACTDRPVKYEAQIVSADTISIINWSFSNGVVLTGSPVNNYYINTGTYNATLIVGTLYGCQDTVTKSITINQSPTITASADVTICKGQSKQLNVTGTTSYSWAPLNGTLSCINCANPIATPLSTTQYVVTGTNSFGCTDIDTVVITVAQPIKLTVSTNDTICIGQSSQLSVTGATTYIWSPGATLNNTTTAFPIATPTLTTKYRVIGFDSHNCFQDTAYIVVAVGQYPTVNLGTDKVLATGTPLPLVTTITNGPITKWTWGPSAATLSCNDCATPIATIKRDMCYTVEVSNLYKCTARDTMCVKVFCENSQVFIPNAFTPDGDGVNDVLVVRAQGISVIKNFRIFNRWGQVVFEKNNFAPNDVNAGWDGKINGKLATADVYVYTCDVICENDISYTYKGNISIIR